MSSNSSRAFVHLVRVTWVQHLFDLMDGSVAVNISALCVAECRRFVDLTSFISSSHQSFLCSDSVLCETERTLLWASGCLPAWGWVSWQWHQCFPWMISPKLVHDLCQTIRTRFCILFTHGWALHVFQAVLVLCCCPLSLWLKELSPGPETQTFPSASAFLTSSPLTV